MRPQFSRVLALLFAFGAAAVVAQDDPVAAATAGLRSADAAEQLRSVETLAALGKELAPRIPLVLAEWPSVLPEARPRLLRVLAAAAPDPAVLLPVVCDAIVREPPEPRKAAFEFAKAAGLLARVDRPLLFEAWRFASPPERKAIVEALAARGVDSLRAALDRAAAAGAHAALWLDAARDLAVALGPEGAPERLRVLGLWQAWDDPERHRLFEICVAIDPVPGATLPMARAALETGEPRQRLVALHVLRAAGRHAASHLPAVLDVLATGPAGLRREALRTIDAFGAGILPELVRHGIGIDGARARAATDLLPRLAAALPKALRELESLRQSLPPDRRVVMIEIFRSPRALAMAAVPLFRNALTDPEASVRAAAVRALVATQPIPDGDWHTLVFMLADADPDVADELDRALAGRRATVPLGEAVRDGAGPLRERALELLLAAGALDATALPVLLEAHDAATGPDRRQILTILRRMAPQADEVKRRHAAALEGASTESRREAAAYFAELLGDQALVRSATEKALADPDAEVRAHAAVAHAQFGAEVLPHLTRLLSGTDPAGIDGALQTAARLGATAAPLVEQIQAMGDFLPAKLRHQHLRTLVALDAESERTLARLRDVLQGPDRELQETALDALRSREQVGAGITQLLLGSVSAEEEDELRSKAMAALRRTTADSIPALLLALGVHSPGIQRAAIGALAELGLRAVVTVPALLALRDSPFLQADVDHALARILGKPLRDELVGMEIERSDQEWLARDELVGRLRRDYLDSSGERRVRLAILLQRIEPEREDLLPAITAALADRPSRSHALFVLARMGETGMSHVLRTLEDPDEDARAEARRALGLPADGALDPQARAVVAGSRTERIEALRALVLHGPKNENLFLHALRDADEDVEILAIGGLHEEFRGSRAACQALLTALREGRPRVRARAASALAGFAIYANDVVPALTLGRKDPDAEVSRAATRALEDLCGPAEESVARLLRASAEATTPSGIEAAWKALAELGPRAIPALVQAHAQDDPVIRELAGRAMHRIGPPAFRAVAARLVTARGSEARRLLSFLHSLGPRIDVAVPELTLALDNPQARLPVVQLLGDLGPSAIPAEAALERIAEEDSTCAAEAREALRRIRSR